MFAEKREAKKERVAKNETQRLKNMARNLQASCYASIKSATFRLVVFAKQSKLQTKNKKKAAVPPEDIARVGLAKEADERTKHDVRI